MTVTQASQPAALQARCPLDATAKMAVLRTPKAHGANQSPPLMPAEPKYTEQAGCDRRGLRNDRATQLEVVDLGVYCARVSSRSPGEEESKREVWRVISRGRDAKTPDLWSVVGWN